MTFWGHSLFYKNLRLHNVSIHRNFYQNRLIYKCVKKSLSKIPGSQSFFVRCRRTVILTNIERGTVYCICLVVARLRTVIKTSICIQKYFLLVGDFNEPDKQYRKIKCSGFRFWYKCINFIIWNWPIINIYKNSMLCKKN